MQRILILVCCLIGLSGFAQRSIVIQEMPNKTTAFPAKFPKDTWIYLKDSSMVYILDTTFQAGQSMATVFVSGKYHLWDNERTIHPGSPGQFYSNDKSWQTPTSVTYKIQAANDAENNWSVPFTLKSTSVIIYNGTPLQSDQWSGSNTLNVALDTRKYDKLVIIN